MKNNLKSRNMSSTKSIPPPTIHIKARQSPYPRAEISRFQVSDEMVPWSKKFPKYEPPAYTAKSVLSGPVWADVEEKDPRFSEIRFNEIDGNVDRVSHHGPYELDGKVPRNPVGRTGLKGRGLLGRWGPNHAADPIVTRWKICDGGILKHNVTGKPILQFIAIQRKDSGEWALPGGMVDPGETVAMTLLREFNEEALDMMSSDPESSQDVTNRVSDLFAKGGEKGMKSPGEDISYTLKREFGEETMNSLEVTEDMKALIRKQVALMFRNGQQVYCGYVDDPRNTDNAWMETVACNFHDETGDSVGKFKLHAGDDAVGVEWKDIDSSLKLYASHTDFLKTTAERHNAHW